MAGLDGRIVRYEGADEQIARLVGMSTGLEFAGTTALREVRSGPVPVARSAGRFGWER